jgi:hypothetical protein
MPRFLIIVFCLVISFANAQVSNVWSPDSLSNASPNHAMNRYNGLLGYHDQLMYLAFPVINPTKARRVPLMEGEGKEGYWLEGNFANRFIIHKGKYYNSKFLQRLRFTFDIALTPRLTRDVSSPLLPSNNKFGLGMDFLLSSLKGFNKEHSTPAWLTVQVHHYSNGQADSFFIDHYFKRNNYRSGDFSTNSLRVLLNLAHLSAERTITSTGAGWQKEIDIKGPFGMSKEFDKSYGRNRLLYYFQWIRVSKLVTRSPSSQSFKAKDSTTKIAKRREVSFRTDVEYILGDLSNFPLKRKGRLGWHCYLTYMPSITNEIGFLLHTFTGRDYLNIRFDDIVFIGEAGLFIRINKR